MTLKIDPNDAMVLLIDLEAGIADKPLTVPYKELRKGVGALCKIATLFAIPVVISGLKNPNGSDAQFLPEIGEALGKYAVHYRTSADSLQNADIKAALESTGRKTLLIGGTVTEIAVQMAALSAIELGYRVYIVVDAAAGVSPRTEKAAFQRLLQAGATTTSAIALSLEIAGDFDQPKGEQAYKILGTLMG